MRISHARIEGFPEDEMHAAMTLFAAPPKDARLLS